MSSAEDALRQYLSLPKGFPMAWGERSEAIVHGGSGKTVAFRAEIEAALESLFRGDLVPPFEAVVMGFKLIREMASEGGGLGGVDSSLWSEPMATAHVVVHILEQADTGKDALRAMSLLNGLGRGLPREGLSYDFPAERTGEELQGAQRIVEAGLALADPDEILRRIRTGVPDEVAAAPVELPIAAQETTAEGAEAIRRLLRELESSEDHAELALLAQRLMAPLRLPRPAALQEDLPIGGYADIANRGEIDRLLLSELAQDDDVLASRIVLGEALFLRREVPKDVPRQDLVIVVDAGIRTWGVTRVFAVAGALAVAASADKGASVTAYRANGEVLEPLDLATRGGIEEHMSRLHADPHPGAAVLRASVERGAEAAASQRVLVTTRAAFHSTELREALVGCGAEWAVVAVDAEGHVELFEYSARGIRLVSSAVVSLEELGAPGAGPGHAQLLGAYPDLPLYIHECPAPLRVGHALDRGVAVAHPEGLLVITQRRQVVFWENEPDQAPLGMRRGGVEIGTLKRGTVLVFGALPRGAIAATYHGKDGLLVRSEFSFDGPADVQEFPVKKQPRVALKSGSTLLLRVAGEAMVAAPGGLRPIVAEDVPWGGALPWGTGMELVRKARIVTLPLLQNVVAIGVLKRSSAAAEIHLFMEETVWALIVQRHKPLRLVQLGGGSEIPSHDFEGRRGRGRGARPLIQCQLPGGPRAWLDHRGLLHLRSAQSGDGDLALTLDVAQELAVWSSRGWTYHQGEAVLGRVGLLDKVNRWVLNFAGEVRERSTGGKV